MEGREECVGVEVGVCGTHRPLDRPSPPPHPFPPPPMLKNKGNNCSFISLGGRGRERERELERVRESDRERQKERESARVGAWPLSLLFKRDKRALHAMSLEPCRFDIACWRPPCPFRHTGAGRAARWAAVWTLLTGQNRPSMCQCQRSNSQNLLVKLDLLSQERITRPSPPLLRSQSLLVKLGFQGSRSTAPRQNPNLQSFLHAADAGLEGGFGLGKVVTPSLPQTKNKKLKVV